MICFTRQIMFFLKKLFTRFQCTVNYIYYQFIRDVYTPFKIFRRQKIFLWSSKWCLWKYPSTYWSRCAVIVTCRPLQHVQVTPNHVPVCLLICHACRGDLLSQTLCASRTDRLFYLLRHLDKTCAASRASLAASFMIAQVGRLDKTKQK